MSESESFEEFNHFFVVELEQFNGPIDLLLHLVKQNELPIEKISLAKVTGQYMSCIERMSKIDLEIAGEYLVIAATLLSIKSSILLDEPPELVQNEEGEMVNPHEELLLRLREAEIYKDGARFLECRDQLDRDVFVPVPDLSTVGKNPPKLKNHDPMMLADAFHKVLKELDDVAPVYEVHIESVSIVERMMWILEELKETSKPLSFRQLVPDLTSRGSVIGSFCALLELCRRQAITFEQGESFGEIYVMAATDSAFDFSGMTSEFDAGSQAVTANA